MLEIKIVLDGNSVKVTWPTTHPGHALKLLEAARTTIEAEMMKKESEPTIQGVDGISAAELAQQILNRRK